jgi:transposase
MPAAELDHDRPDDLDPAGQASLDAILAGSPELTALTGHVRASARLMTGRRGRELEQWMTAAAASGEPALKSFVPGLRADQDAVTAGLTLRWSSCARASIHAPATTGITPVSYGSCSSL